MKEFLGKMKKGLARILSAVFGPVSLNWSAPPWIKPSWAWLKKFWKPVVGTVVLASLIGGIWCWIANRPEPEPLVPPNYITVEVGTPGLARSIEGELTPQPLRLEFSQTAAPLQESEEDPVVGIELDPEVEGLWKWWTDRILTFTPASEWLPNVKYEVEMTPEQLLVESVVLKNTEVDFTTPKFTAELVSTRYYQNPKDPDIKQVVAALKFSHGVDPDALKRQSSFQVLGDTPLFAAGVDPIEKIIFEDHNRTAYVRSLPIAPPAKEDFVKVEIAGEVGPARGEAEIGESLTGNVRVPDVYSYFQITGVNVGSRRTENGEPEPYLAIATEGLTTSENLNPNLKVRLLPARRPNQPKWQLAELTPGVLRDSPVVELDPDKRPEAEVEREHFNSFSYSFGRYNQGRQLLIEIAAETPAIGGYRLRSDFRVLRDIPAAPKELHLLGRWGGILALGGDHKITVKSRNLPGLRYRVGRVPAGQLNHLVSQTRGDFGSPNFNYNFNETNFAHFAEEVQPVFLRNSYEANYSTFDLTPHLNTEDPFDSDASRGLFFLRVSGWDAKKNQRISAGGREGEQSFVLVTDLGMVVKQNYNRTRDVFVQSISTGEPVVGAEVSVLGKNGIPVLVVTTNAEGRARLKSIDQGFADEKQPVALVVRKGTDLSFMPLNHNEHHVSLSRFDVGGLRAPTAKDLDGFAFTERGIYRPGDPIHIGVIVKSRDWTGQLDGLPIQVTVQDARNRTIKKETLRLPASGFADARCPTEYASATGVYKVLIHLVTDPKKPILLASTTARVEEFQPDTMKVQASLTPGSGAGWIKPQTLKAEVAAQNLYGTPATGRLVTGKIYARPGAFAFDGFDGYTFFDRNAPEARYHDWEAGDEESDDGGNASFEISLDAITDATYSVRFHGEVFEADSGRGVKAFSEPVLVSPLDFAVGYRAEGGLSYIPARAKKSVHLVAVNPKLERIQAANVRFEVKETFYVSALTQRGNGNYAYESVQRERVVEKGDLTIKTDSGYDFKLPTEGPGEFTVTLTDEEDRVLTIFGYSVVGKGNRSRSMDENAELFVQLAKREVKAGEELELSITAPFTGSGLITIEREKVYAHQYFTTNTNSSTQKIRVPAGMEGTAYVNITFLRALDSPEIFVSPLSYAVEPFRIVDERRNIKVQVETPELARPGKPMTIKYQADRACKIVLYGVDEGILQVTGYDLPKPLPHFERKRALLVQTFQILDLLMPEHRLIQDQLSAFGGGADFHLNPFKRVTEAPVVFWSGVIDAGPGEGEYTYNVPDYFSGSLRVMAVAVARDGMGQAEKSTVVQSPVLIQPGVPTFAAPGDIFDVSVTLGNNLEPEAGNEAEITLEIEASEHLEVIHAPEGAITVARGREETLTFPVKATGVLGNATLKLRAAAGGETAVRSATLSVRPAAPYLTLIESGYTEEPKVDISVKRELYAEYHQAEATVSVLPLSLARGLNEYLSKFPHGCTEQITSGAFARLLLAREADFGLTPQRVQQQIDHTVRILRSRMNPHGGFGYWYSGPTRDIDFLSIYVAHFLTEAKDAGFTIPEEVLKLNLDYLRKMAGVTKPEGRDYRDQAYAIYILTRNEEVSTNYILNLRDFLAENVKDNAWKSDLTAVFLAASYQILKQEEEALKLLHGFDEAKREAKEDDDFHSPLSQDAQYLAILSRYFPKEAKQIGGRQLMRLVEPIVANRFSTLSAAYSVMALKSYSEMADQFPIKLVISQVTGQNEPVPLPTSGGKLISADFEREVDLIRISAEKEDEDEGPRGVFYQVVEGGFDTEQPKELMREGMEVHRQLLGPDGEPTTEIDLDETITVRLRLRSLDRGKAITNVALVDLLPGGFEVVRETIPAGRSKFPGIEFNEVREDRVVLFGTAAAEMQIFEYQIRPTRRGEFVVPPVMADSMYDRSVRSRGLASRITVK
ncbi:MAG: hypothetical protein ACI8UO_001565 [Verrucomicrobiales bacterium]|jgi:uncharacterized protein YfaS (alpha-2-macroglobulin family)